MNQIELLPYLEFAKTQAHEAGKIMLDYFNSDKGQTIWKSDNTPVTMADSKINEMIISAVKSHFPEHGVIGEEGSHEPGREAVWVVDPIDGTALYDIGMPAATFCLAFVLEGKVQVSVVLNPFEDQLFHAVRNQGAFLNNSQIHCNDVAEFSHSYVFVPSSSKKSREVFGPVIDDLKDRGAKTMFIPSFTYLATLVLLGKGIAAVMPYGSPWDAAAISLIVQEAGGLATDIAGNVRKYNEWGDGILISNGHVHDQMVQSIQNANTRN